MITVNQLSSFADFYLVNSSQVHHLFFLISPLVLTSVPSFRNNTCCNCPNFPQACTPTSASIGHTGPQDRSLQTFPPYPRHTHQRENFPTHTPWGCGCSSLPSLQAPLPFPSVRLLWALSRTGPPTLQHWALLRPVVTCTRPITNIEQRHRL